MTHLSEKLRLAFAARCHKLRYESETFAQRLADRRGHATGWHLHVYRCPNCFGWHLTKRQLFAAQKAVPR